MIVEVISQAPVAQLDRARASDARCRKFESCQVHFCIQNPKDLVMRELMLCEIHGLDLEEMEWNKEI